MVTRNQIQQSKKEMEERAGQEIRQKLQEVNLFLQIQAASQDRLEQIRQSSYLNEKPLKCRIKDLKFELDRIKILKTIFFKKNPCRQKWKNTKNCIVKK